MRILFCALEPHLALFGPENLLSAVILGSDWIVAFFRRKVSFGYYHAHFCAAVDKEIGLTQHETIAAAFIFQ